MPLSDLHLGYKHTDQLFVTQGLTVPGLAACTQEFPLFATMPEVLALAMMIAHIEHTCVQLLRSYLESHEGTVGIAFNLTHSAPTPAGPAIFTEVIFQELDGRRLTFGITCRDARGVIGAGTHQRALIDHDRFIAAAAKRTAG